MKIEDFIELLKKYNPEAEITLTISEDITLSYIDADGKYTPKDTPFVFVEPMDSCPTCVHEYDESGMRMCGFYRKPCKLVEECFQFVEFTDFV